MNLDGALKHTAVIGAAGKMGSGISLLLLQEAALSEIKQTGDIGKGDYQLILVDVSSQALADLKKYLSMHLTRFAEQQINLLRQMFENNASLVSNEQIVNAFVNGALSTVQFTSKIEDARNSALIFEAIVEDLQLKTALFHKLVDGNSNPLYFFTNTSSIPIHILNESGDLHNRIIGFHFYNPPTVQKLIELIPLNNGEPMLYEWASELAKRLNKRVVLSRDVAGFIGNGFLLRESLYACAKTRELTEKYSLAQAVYMINKVTQDFLVRPMGIFQLLDYIGLDVASKIGRVMNAYLLHGSYDDELIENMLQIGILGGQYPDGSQKDGFFKYEKGHITGVYCFIKKGYISLDEGEWKKSADAALGELPKEYLSWKELHKQPDILPKIHNYFISLKKQKNLGAEIAQHFIYKDNEILRVLVDDGVAHTPEDVKVVLKNGFYHLYGPQDVTNIEENECAR